MIPMSSTWIGLMRVPTWLLTRQYSRYSSLPGFELIFLASRNSELLELFTGSSYCTRYFAGWAAHYRAKLYRTAQLDDATNKLAWYDST